MAAVGGAHEGRRAGWCGCTVGLGARGRGGLEWSDGGKGGRVCLRVRSGTSGNVGWGLGTHLAVANILEGWVVLPVPRSILCWLGNGEGEGEGERG